MRLVTLSFTVRWAAVSTLVLMTIAGHASPARSTLIDFEELGLTEGSPVPDIGLAVILRVKPDAVH
jgi:hypothetical protein